VVYKHTASGACLLMHAFDFHGNTGIIRALSNLLCMRCNCLDNSQLSLVEFWLSFEVVPLFFAGLVTPSPVFLGYDGVEYTSREEYRPTIWQYQRGIGENHHKHLLLAMSVSSMYMNGNTNLTNSGPRPGRQTGHLQAKCC
jgi:hypothetical protein